MSMHSPNDIGHADTAPAQRWQPAAVTAPQAAPAQQPKSRTALIVSLAVVLAALILGASAVAISTLHGNATRPVATVSPAPAKTIIKKITHNKTVIVPAAPAAPAAGQAPINNLRQVEPGVYANQSTSDAFAENIVSAWNGSPGVQDVYSPVTGLTYPVTYTDQGNGTIVATGGNGALVEFSG